MLRLKVVIGTVLISLCLTLPVPGQEMEFVSSTLHHNPYYSIGKVGEYVYCGGPYGIHIFDISDPAEPELIKIYDILDINKMFIDGSYAYLISRYNSDEGLRILDISSPLDPQMVSMLYFGFEGDVTEVYYDNTIYTSKEYFGPYGTGYSKILVLNLSDPYNPVFSDSITLGYLTVDMWAADGYLNITEQEFDFWENRWRVYSLSDPAHPTYHCYLDFGLDYVGQVSAYQNYSYVQVNSNIHIYDISVFNNPVLVRIESCWDFPNFISIHDTVGYASVTQGIRTYDMSDPVYPAQIGYVNIPYGVGSFFYGGDTCFTAIIRSTSFDDASKFNIVDFSDLYNPVVIGEHWTAGKSYDVQLRGDYAYIANGSAGLTIVDISDPVNPIPIDSSILNSVIDIFIEGNRAYVLAGTAYFGICDISNPVQPVLLGYHSDFTGRPKNVYAEGDYAYVVKVPHNNPQAGFIAIYDISDPSNPTPAYSIENLYFPRYINVDSGYAYISCYDDLKIYDVSNLDSITFVSSYLYRNRAYHFSINQPFLYMACDNTALEIIDISDPANPYFVGDYDSLLTNRVTIFDNYSILKKPYALYLMDISNPEAPYLISNYLFPADWYLSEEVSVRDDYIYNATYSRFEILRLTPTGIEEVSTLNLDDFSFPQNYPNPFNASTTITYSLPQPADIRIEIFDILGRKVETLFSGPQEAGEHTVNWRPGDISSGVYYYRIGSEDFIQSRSCLLVK